MSVVLLGCLWSYIARSLSRTAIVPWFPHADFEQTLYLQFALGGVEYAGVMTSLQLSAREFALAGRTGLALGLVTMLAWSGHAMGGWKAGLMFDLSGR